MERSKSIFGNPISAAVYQKAVKTKEKYLKKFGDDSQTIYHLASENNLTLNKFLGIKNLVLSEQPQEINFEKSVIVGNIRMGFGHYRISMAIASAAQSLGYTPYWFDLHAYQTTTGGKVIAHLNSLYSLGSKLSQQYALFNKYYWEPLNSEGFKKLSYNAIDQKVAELMTPIFAELPKEIPYLATHVWPAQAAVHAGLTKVVNVIPDNWPMALHLAEGSLHTVQTPSAYFGYKTLKGMAGTKILQPIPEGELFEVGHYVDHELVENLEADCRARLVRLKQKAAKRILLTVGGAGAQQEIFVAIIKELLPLIKKGAAVLYINVGDHHNVWEGLVKALPELEQVAQQHFDNWDETCEFANHALTGEVSGVHAFYHQEIFAAVYASNLLMRSTDLLVTKPSELSFYPVPKLLIKRVGGHEAWGAIRAAEVGDGTIECETIERTLQMLKLILNSDEMLAMFCEKIIRAKESGIYHGAYRAIRLAVNGEI